MAPLTPLQKRILLVLSIAVALTRFLAVARSLNDWDEALFAMGVAEYDVNLHHPHPPGYPLFVAAAKAVHLFGVNEYRSLQAIVLLGAMLLFPALVCFARELGFEFATAVCAALIFTFLPNVWIYGGTGFSDVPSATLGLIACTLLLRGRHSSRAYILGAIVLGIAAGVRLPNLVIGLVPALLATWHRLRARDFRSAIAAILLGATILGGSYLGAALSSGTIEQYRMRVREQSEYVRNVDSWHNPHRAPLRDLAKVFFLWPMRQQQQMGSLSALAGIGIAAVLLRRRWPLLMPLAVFGPTMVLAWLNLDIEAVGRYAIAYLAMHAIFVAYALQFLGRKRAVQGALTAIVVLVFAVWTWPALRLQRTTNPPATEALLWIKQHVPKTAGVYVQGGLGPHATYLLPEHRLTFYERSEEISRIGAETWIVDTRSLEGAQNFAWPRTNPMWKIIRRRNFEAAIVKLHSLIAFYEGWHLPEGEGADTFRWMGKEARAGLPPIPSGGLLTMRIYVPVDTIQPPPTIEIRVNGAVVDRFVGSQAFVEKAWRVASRKDAENELRIITSDVVVPGNGDTRELGLRIDALSWTPAL